MRWADAESREADYEAELAVIIGSTATGVVANRLDTCCPLGPWIVTPDGVGSARTPPRYMGDGDVMTVWIDWTGELIKACVVN